MRTPLPILDQLVVLSRQLSAKLPTQKNYKIIAVAKSICLKDELAYI